MRRLEGLVPAENILILTNADQETGVRMLAGKLPAENIVAEPAKRDTAAAIALAVAWVSKRDPQATMVVLPADHLITDTAGFQQTLRTAAAAAEQTGALVTIGIAPTWACPGFGYIEFGAATSVRDVPTQPAVHEVTSFREKPSTDLAESFLAQGNFCWNAGMFIWTIPAILSAFRDHAAALSDFIAHYLAGDGAAVLAQEFPALPKISIDYAIMEKAARVLMVEAGFDWDDVGGWLAVAKYLPTDASDNCGNTTLHSVDAQGNIVYSDQPTLVGLLGVKDLIVVRTGDALLVCHRAQAERIKTLVAQLPGDYQ